jgi:hypothetical protein
VAETILKEVLNVVRADTLGQRLGFTPEPLLYLEVNVGNGIRSNTVTSKDSPCEILYVLNGVMTYGYKKLLVAIVAIIIADVRPLVAVTGPYLAPAPTVGGIVVIVRPRLRMRKTAPQRTQSCGNGDAGRRSGDPGRSGLLPRCGQ